MPPPSLRSWTSHRIKHTWQLTISNSYYRDKSNWLAYNLSNFLLFCSTSMCSKTKKSRLLSCMNCMKKSQRAVSPVLQPSSSLCTAYRECTTLWHSLCYNLKDCKRIYLQFEKRSSFIRKWWIEVRLYACMHVNLLYKFAIFKWDNNPAQETLRPTRIAFGSS